MSKRYVGSVGVLALVATMLAVPLTVEASHAWGDYHWARTSNPFTLRVIDSMTSGWDDNLAVAMSDWDASSVLNLVGEAGDSSTKTRKRCTAVVGKVHVCNATYGYNGWLGVAQIWVSGSHITKATAKMNDSYLASSGYTETNRQHVICQEVGHDWGLDHQDESGADLNTCMDYSTALDNPHPNAHDYEELETIYAHLDSTSTVASLAIGSATADAHAQADWGGKVFESANGGSAVFVRYLGGGVRIITHVIWAR